MDWPDTRPPDTLIVNGDGHDAPERVHVTEELRAAEDRFAAAFYASPTAKAITTLDEGRYVEVNEAFEQQIGYSRTEIYGRTSLELSVWPTPSDRAAMIAALQRQSTIRVPHAQFRTKSGRLITTIYSATLVQFGGVPCVLADIVDVTAQQVAEHALRESEAKFRLLAETVVSCIFIYRQDGTLCYFNPQMETATGYSAEELRGMTVWDILHPDVRGLLRARAAARWRGEPVPDRYQLTILTKGGETRWVDFTARLIEFEREPAILGTAFDITETKRHEQRAQEYTATLQTLIANSPFGIMVGGKDHRITFCNPAFQRIFRYTEDEVLGKEPDDLVGLPGDPEAAELSRQVLGGQVVHATTIRRRKDGTKVNVEVHAIPLLAGDTFVGCFGIYQDITERVEAAAKVQALQTRLRRVQDEERAQVARELHDNIGQQLALLGLHLTALENEARDAAPSIISSLAAARRLNERIGAEAHHLSHRLHPSQLVHLSLPEALAGFCDEFGRLNDLDIDFQHHEVPDLSSEVTTCVFRVAQEAIRNAEKHSGCRRIRIELTVASGELRLRVSDTGRGFNPAIADGSSGLGLVSMKERVRAVGGELTIRSAVDQGTCVEVSIPLPQLAAADATVT